MTKIGRHIVSNKSWDRYKNHIKAFLDLDAGRQTIVWAKHVDQILSHGEDYTPYYERVDIEALCFYNYFRNWPINESTVAGENDQENLSILISQDYLKNLSGGKYYIDLGDGSYKIDFNWAEDRFIINGRVYRPSGDTQVAQAKDEAIVYMIILKLDSNSVIKFIEQDVKNGFAGKEGVYFMGNTSVIFAGKNP